MSSLSTLSLIFLYSYLCVYISIWYLRIIFLRKIFVVCYINLVIVFSTAGGDWRLKTQLNVIGRQINKKTRAWTERPSEDLTNDNNRIECKDCAVPNMCGLRCY